MENWKGPVTRAAVRKLAEDQFRELTAAAATGRNAHQFALDQQDAIEALALTVPEDERDLFLRLYAEETNAVIQSSAHETAAYQARTAEWQAEAAAQVAQEQAQRSAVLPIVIGLVVALLIYLALRGA